MRRKSLTTHRPEPLSHRGITLVELVVGFSVFTLLMVVLAAALTRSQEVWRRANASNSSQVELRKAFWALDRDLKETTFETVRATTGPVSLTGFDGDAVWFLSAQDPTTGEFLRTDDGHPLWQRNILYYAVVPDQHRQLHGFDCAGGADGDGYETFCPHKVLLRKVIDNPPGAAGPVVGSSDQELLLDVSPYLTRPQGYAPSTGEPGLESVTIAAKNLIEFRASLEPNPGWNGEVSITLSAARIEEASRLIRVGSEPLDSFAQTFSFSLFPPLK